MQLSWGNYISDPNEWRINVDEWAKRAYQDLEKYRTFVESDDFAEFFSGKHPDYIEQIRQEKLKMIDRVINKQRVYFNVLASAPSTAGTSRDNPYLELGLEAYKNAPSTLAHEFFHLVTGSESTWADDLIAGVKKDSTKMALLEEKAQALERRQKDFQAMLNDENNEISLLSKKRKKIYKKVEQEESEAIPSFVEYMLDPREASAYFFELWILMVEDGIYQPGTAITEDVFSRLQDKFNSFDVVDPLRVFFEVYFKDFQDFSSATEPFQRLGVYTPTDTDSYRTRGDN